jgi:NADH-quinone oxidoreductase subunit J
MLNKQWMVGLAATIVLGATMIGALLHEAKTVPHHFINLAEPTNTQDIGMLLYGRTTGYYMFPFEIASILLLVAVIGAVVMAKRRV